MKVWIPSTTRKIARIAMAAAKKSWNQSPQRASPSQIITSFFLTVMRRLFKVAASMNTIGT